MEQQKQWFAGLNCLSALRSIVTRYDKCIMCVCVYKSQLPFGFDVDCYVLMKIQVRLGSLKSQLPFGFDVDCYKHAVLAAWNATLKSQLPFGFDVDCYGTGPRALKRSSSVSIAFRL